MKLAKMTRRFFLMGSAAAVAGCATAGRRMTRRISPNEKINFGGIGVGGKGRGDVNAGKGHNIIALCDVDDLQAARTYADYPNARKYRDFREMLEKEKELDAVTISTPDHFHAVAAMAAMELGLAVYVQKPLTYSVAEARALTKAAARYGVATQMGNQGHSGEGVRALCEMLWSGVIGDITEVHCWTNRPVWPQGIAEPLPAEPVPSTIDWDLWLGPAPERPYNKGYAPFNWRGWWDFGCGALGDMGCHIMDPPNTVLHLGAPSAVERVMEEGNSNQTGPLRSIIKYEFPARVVDGKTLPAVSLFWYDGKMLPPRPEGIPAEDQIGDGDNGSLFIGTKGFVSCGCYGENPRLHPQSLMNDYKMPAPYLERTPNNSPHEDWYRAIRTGYQACSNFSYSGPFTETVLLGNLAIRAGGRIEWDSKNMCVTNNPDANQYVERVFRKGWSL